MCLLVTMSNNKVHGYVTETNEVESKIIEEHDKLIFFVFAVQCSWNREHHKQKFTFISANFMDRNIMNRSDNLLYKVFCILLSNIRLHSSHVASVLLILCEMIRTTTNYPF